MVTEEGRLYGRRFLLERCYLDGIGSAGERANFSSGFGLAMIIVIDDEFMRHPYDEMKWKGIIPMVARVQLTGRGDCRHNPSVL